MDYLTRLVHAEVRGSQEECMRAIAENLVRMRALIMEEMRRQAAWSRWEGARALCEMKHIAITCRGTPAPPWKRQRSTIDPQFKWRLREWRLVDSEND